MTHTIELQDVLAQLRAGAEREVRAIEQLQSVLRAGERSDAVLRPLVDELDAARYAINDLRHAFAAWFPRAE